LYAHIDYGAVHEKTETLSELLSAKRSPWNMDYSWSDEAKKLRKIAVKSPWLIDDNFVFSHFKTLRMIDRGVSGLFTSFIQVHSILFCRLQNWMLRLENSKTSQSLH
jgi:hypothetical protein